MNWLPFGRRTRMLEEALTLQTEALGGLQAMFRDAVGSLEPVPTVIPPPFDAAPITARLDELERFQTHLGNEMLALKVATAHAIEHEERREKRIQGTIRRARKQLEKLGVEDPGLEAEFEGLELLPDDVNQVAQADLQELLPEAGDLDAGESDAIFAALRRQRGF